MASDDENARNSVRLLQELWAVLLGSDLQLQLVLSAFLVVGQLVFVGPVLDIIVVVPYGH